MTWQSSSAHWTCQFCRSFRCAICQELQKPRQTMAGGNGNLLRLEVHSRFAKMPPFPLADGHCHMGLFKIMVPQNCPYAALSRTLRALSCCSKINTWNHDHVFVCIFRINSGIQTFREPFAALSRSFATAAKNIHSYLQMSLGY